LDDCQVRVVGLTIDAEVHICLLGNGLTIQEDAQRKPQSALKQKPLSAQDCFNILRRKQMTKNKDIRINERPMTNSMLELIVQ